MGRVLDFLPESEWDAWQEAEAERKRKKALEDVERQSVQPTAWQQAMSQPYRAPEPAIGPGWQPDTVSSPTAMWQSPMGPPKPEGYQPPEPPMWEGDPNVPPWERPSQGPQPRLPEHPSGESKPFPGVEGFGKLAEWAVPKLVEGHELQRRYAPGYAGTLDVLGRAAEPFMAIPQKGLELAGKGLEAYQEKVSAPINELAAERLGRDSFYYTEPATDWEKLAQRWAERPERYPGEKLAGEVLIDPLNAPLPGVGEAIKVAGKGAQRAARGIKAAREAMPKAGEVVQAAKGVGRTLADETGSVQLATPRDPNWYYSQLQRTIETKVGKSIPPNDLRGLLRSSGVKPDEMKWTGFDDFLNQKAAEGKPVTKQEALDFLAQNNVQVEEVVKGDLRLTDLEVERRGELLRKYDNSPGSLSDAEVEELAALNAKERKAGPLSTKFAKWQLPGGENYRELLLTLPEKQVTDSEFAKSLVVQSSRDRGEIKWFIAKDGDLNAVPYNFNTRQEAEAYRQRLIRQKTPSQAYQSPHFSEPNILAHVRFNERVDAQGKKVLFVEEIQSDWHQTGREKGYKQAFTELPEGYIVKPVAGRYSVMKPDGKPVIYGMEGLFDTAEQSKRAALEQLNRVGITGNEVPAAPFAKTWPELTFKRILRWAAENDFDRVAWTTGKQQAERYDLAKQISELAYWKEDADTWGVSLLDSGGRPIDGWNPNTGLTASELERQIGKDVTKRIVGDEGYADSLGGYPKSEDVHYLSNEGLSIGGEGMKGFYDVMLPSTVDKYAKKWGAKVGETKLEVPTTRPARTVGDYREHGGKVSTTEQVTAHAIDVTPSMKQSVLEGQALFQVVPPVVGGAAGYDPNATPQENAQRMALGAAGGAGLARVARGGRIGFGVEDITKGKPSAKTVSDFLAGRKSARIGTLVIDGKESLPMTLAPDTSEIGTFSIIIHNPKATGGQVSRTYRMKYRGRESIDEVLQHFQEHMNIDDPGRYKVDAIAARPVTPKAEPRPRTQVDEWRKELKERESRRFKGANEVIQIDRLKAKIALDPAKWQVGQGVGWRLPGQVNRGFRIVEVYPETKQALIRSVADTGLTSTGGDYDKIDDELVDMIDLLRDKKYDGASPARPATPPAELTPPQPAAAMPVAGPAEGKQPWEMTRQAYSDERAKRVSGQSVRKTRKLSETYHKITVRQALSDGLPVPEAVRNEYPDLARRSPITPQGLKGNPPVPQGPLNSAASNTAQVSDILESPAFRKKGLGGLDVPTQRLVLSRVLAALHQPEIRQVVVQSVPVDVVDNLVSLQSPTYVRLHDANVLKDLLTVNLDGSVSLRSDIANSLTQAITDLATEQARRTSETVGSALDKFATGGAVDLNQGPAEFPVARIGTEKQAASILADESRLSKNRPPANVAGQVGTRVNVGHESPPTAIIAQTGAQGKPEVLADYPDLAAKAKALASEPVVEATTPAVTTAPERVAPELAEAQRQADAIVEVPRPEAAMPDIDRLPPRIRELLDAAFADEEVARSYLGSFRMSREGLLAEGKSTNVLDEMIAVLEQKWPGLAEKPPSATPPVAGGRGATPPGGGQPPTTPASTVETPIKVELTTPQPEAAKVTQAQLPPQLSKASPRYKSQQLNFESDVDRALYIVAHAGVRSKADQQYMEWLAGQLPGLSPGQIRQKGAQVKLRVKAAAGATTDPVVTIPRTAAETVRPPGTDRPTPPGQPPIPPTEPPAGAAGQPVRPDSWLASMKPTQEVLDAAYQSDWIRRLADRLDNVIVRPIAQALGVPQRDVFAQGLVLRESIMNDGKSTVTGAMARLREQGTSTKLFNVKDDITTLRDGTTAPLNDVLEYPDRYALSPEQKRYAETIHKLYDDQRDLLASEGITINELAFEPGGHYVGRKVVFRDNPDGSVEMAQIGGGARRPGAKATFEKRRSFETEAEAKAQGFHYATPEEALQINLQAAYRRIADQRLANHILSQIPYRTGAAPEELRLARDSARDRLATVGKLKLVINRGYRGERVPDGTVASIGRFFPDEAKGLIDAGITKPEDPLVRAKLQEVEQRLPLLTAQGKADYYQAAHVLSKASEQAKTAHFGEGMVQAPAFQGKFFSEADAKRLRQILDLEGQSPVRGLARSISWVNALPRALLTTWDVGTPFLQGQVVMFSHPIVWGKSVKEMVKALASEKMDQAFLAAHADTINKWGREGAIFTPSEFTTAFQSGGIATKVPVLRQAAMPFVRAYENFLNAARIYGLEATEGLARTEADRVGLARFWNEMTGQIDTAKMGISATQREVETAALFAPRYRRAIIALMTDVSKGGLRGQMARRDLAKASLAGLAGYVGVSYMLGQEPKLDPNDPKFLTVNVFGQNVGISGAFVGTSRAMMQMALTPDKAHEIAAKYVRNQTSPIVSTAIRGYQLPFLYDSPLKLTKQVVLGNATPIWAQNWLLEGQAGEGAILGSIVEAGGGKAFPDRSEKQKLTPYQRLTQGGGTKNKLTPYQRQTQGEAQKGKLTPYQRLTQGAAR